MWIFEGIVSKGFQGDQEKIQFEQKLFQYVEFCYFQHTAYNNLINSNLIQGFSRDFEADLEPQKTLRALK